MEPVKQQWCSIEKAKLIIVLQLYYSSANQRQMERDICQYSDGGNLWLNKPAFVVTLNIVLALWIHIQLSQSSLGQSGGPWES